MECGKAHFFLFIQEILFHREWGEKTGFPQGSESENQSRFFSPLGISTLPIICGKNVKEYVICIPYYFYQSLELMFAVISRRLSSVSLSPLAIRASTFCREEMTVV